MYIKYEKNRKHETEKSRKRFAMSHREETVSGERGGLLMGRRSINMRGQQTKKEGNITNERENNDKWRVNDLTMNENGAANTE
jgi:hypothetical protein